MKSTPSGRKIKDPKFQRGDSISFRAPQTTKLRPGMARDMKIFLLIFFFKISSFRDSTEGHPNSSKQPNKLAKPDFFTPGARAAREMI